MVGDPASLSREFCTLVVSIRRPLEDELAESGGLSAARRDRLRTLHRNVMRMLHLANALLDLPELVTAVRVDRALVDLAAKTMVIPILREAGAGLPQGTARPERDAGGAMPGDLRAPLLEVAGFSQTLLDDHAHALDRAGRELLEQIHAHAQRMSGLVDDALARPPPR